jgi:glutamyl-tRNA(Gln) amidotransferase subunit E
MGTVDVAAEAEGVREFTYFNKSCNCLVYTDEEPPRGPNQEAIEIALQFAKLVGANVIEEMHFMRKVVVDGSNTSGFQRTALVAIGGKIEYENGTIDIEQICLEEDSCRYGENKDEYLLDRLGIPLLEITTKPQLKEPKQVQMAAKALGRLLRACRVKRGLGTIRQDVNVSIDGGERVELKGFQDLSTMSKVVENEIIRQQNLKDLSGTKASEPVEVTEHISKDRGTAIACKLAGWKEKLGTKKSPEGHIRMGRELADYAKKAGVQGLMHSDELPAYDISSVETNNLHQLLECKENDAFVLIFGEKKIVEDAIRRVIERIEIDGVPKEVRRVTPEGLTRFLRPMPGASRMYPETDIPPIKLTNIKVKAPKTLDQREKEMPLNDEESKQIVSRNLDYKFRNFMKYYGEAKTISRLLLHTLPNLKSKNGKIIKEEAIIKVLELVKEGKIAKEGIEGALIRANSGKDIKIRNENIEEDVVKFIDKLINDKLDFIRQRGMEAIGPLMGPVMSEFRGKMDGAKINALLIKKIKEKM